jgi:hypothetical protein
MRLSKLTCIAGMLLVSAPAITFAADMGGITPTGQYLILGGGVTDFYESDVKDRVDVGGTWDLRLGLGTRSILGAEVAYVGGARNAEGFGDNLLSNGAEGVLRLQYPFGNGTWRLAPFAFGGIGWSRLDVDNALGISDESDDVGVVPFGAGLMLEYGALVLDTRFTHRETFSEDLIEGPDGDAASLRSWAVTASVGYAF